jgi:triacylglycerol esterase/lipase EstA (alpha/beta hydrolase family)
VPSAAHPNPVVLVPGTWATAASVYGTLSPLLAGKGYCVYSLNYGAMTVIGTTMQSIAPMENSAAELAGFVDQVLAATGAQKVDIIGHSQGGLMPRYYINNLGGSSKVGSMVSLAGTNQGTNAIVLMQLAGLLQVPHSFLQMATDSWCPACGQQLVGSPFLTALNAGGGTVSNVKYVNIVSQYDWLVSPHTNAFLPAASNVKNHKLQSYCVFDYSEHFSLSFDTLAHRLVLNALDPANAKPASCFSQL